MKKQITDLFIILLSFIVAIMAMAPADARPVVKSQLIITISYFSKDNSIQYLAVNAKSKVEGRFQPVKSIAIKLFLNKDTTGKGLGNIATIVTDYNGNAIAEVPPTLQKIWKSSTSHTFIAVTDKNKDFDSTITEISINPAKLSVDTAQDKMVVGTLCEFKDNNWIPVKGVDIKIGIKRLGAYLPIGDEQSYTTDSLGQAKGEFKRSGIPGDAAGNIILTARVEDNDQYGNLSTSSSILWGSKFIAEKDFFHRALWASRFHSPFWLVFMAYSILIAVWGTLIYLLFLILKIRKLGKEVH